MLRESGASAWKRRSDELLLQRVPLQCDLPVRDLYWRLYGTMSTAVPEATVTAEPALAIRPGTILNFDTYFGAFFETQWRLHTRLATLALRIRVSGRGVLRVIRRVDGDLRRLIEIPVENEQVIRLPAETLNFRQHGRVFFELVVQSAPLVLHEAA